MSNQKDKIKWDPGVMTLQEAFNKIIDSIEQNDLFMAGRIYGQFWEGGSTENKINALIDFAHEYYTGETK